MKRSLFLSGLALVSLIFTSCASYEMPAGYNGPTATISSTSQPVNLIKAEGYYISSINGKFVSHSPMNTPRGGGMGISLQNETIKVPCEPLTLGLRGGHIYAADGPALADSMIGQSRSVTGEITFTPKPNTAYQVTGITSKSSTAVWITDCKSGKVVSQKLEN
jgi:hypothetical protein